MYVGVLMILVGGDDGMYVGVVMGLWGWFGWGLVVTVATT